MSKYPTVKLGDIFTLQMGKTPARNNADYWKNGTNNWVSISDIGKDSKFIYTTKESISDKAVIESGIKIVPQNTIIMSFKLSIGKTAITTSPIYTNEAIMAFIPKNEISCDLLFLYHLFTNKDWTEGLNKSVKGTTLNKASLSLTRIPFPSITEQKRISTNLDRIFTLIGKRKQQLSKLDELAKSRFLEMFGDPILNPMGWAISHYGDEFEIMSGGTPKTDIPEYWVNGKISWIGSNLCQNSVLIENDGKFITEKGLNNSSAKIFNKGYILIALVGATIGKVAHLKFSTSTNQNIAGINVPQNENYIPEFVFYNTQFLYPKFMDIGNSKFKMANLSFIRSLQIPIVPIKAQKKFSNFVEQLDKSKFRIKKSLEKLEMTYKALLQEYFG